MTSEVRKMLTAERERILKEIRVSAEKADAARVLSATDNLREIEALLARQDELDRAARALLDRVGSVPTPAFKIHTGVPMPVDSARAIGAKRRAEFVESVRNMGRHLVQV